MWAQCITAASDRLSLRHRPFILQSVPQSYNVSERFKNSSSYFQIKSGQFQSMFSAYRTFAKVVSLWDLKIRREIHTISKTTFKPQFLGTDSLLYRVSQYILISKCYAPFNLSLRALNESFLRPKNFRASNYSLSIVVLSNLPDLSKTFTQSNLIANGLLNRNNQQLKSKQHSAFGQCVVYTLRRLRVRVSLWAI